MRNPFRHRDVVDDELGDEFTDPDEGEIDPVERYGVRPEAAAHAARLAAPTGETPKIVSAKPEADRVASGDVSRPRAPSSSSLKEDIEQPPPATRRRRFGRAKPGTDDDQGTEADQNDRHPGADSDPGDGPSSETDSTMSPDEFVDELAAAEPRGPSEQRSAWAYLGLLGGLFCFVLIFGYGCSEQRGSSVSTSDSAESAAAGQPSQLVFRVDGDVIAAEGSVPDEAAKAQLLSLIEGEYGAENVLDDVVIDEASTLDEGTVRFVGSADADDPRPEALQQAIINDFGLTNRGFEIGEVNVELVPVDAEVAIADGRVSLIGLVPDEQSLNDLVAMGTQVWGPENVDSSGLVVADSTTWTDGRIRVTGSADSTDERPGAFTGLVPSRIGNLVAVDINGLTIVDTSQLLIEVQTTVEELLALSPIQFSPNSPEISSESDQVLIDIAEALAQLPNVPFEVVGHTDSVGDAQENLVLSQDRAVAVVERLTTLGVDADRMSSRGEGETKPIAENDTDEGKAANRRIEFVLVGTSDIDDTSG